MSMQLPVISTNIAGIPEVVFDGVTGYLTTPGNIEEFSDIYDIEEKLDSVSYIA